MYKYAFFKNKIDGSEPINVTNAPGVVVTPVIANVNLGNVINFNISADRTTQPTFYWTIQGNVTTGDFSDSEGLSGSIQLDATGNATITKELIQIGNANIDFYMDIRTGSPATPIEAISNTVFTEDVATMTVTGGDEIITVNEFYKAHQFNTSANINIVDLGDSANFYSTLANVEYLAVAGGGGGGYASIYPRNPSTYQSDNHGAAGGGAGGEVLISSNIVSLANYSISIGSGGTGGNGISGTPVLPTAGGNTTVFGNTLQGGSYGGSVRTNVVGNITAFISLLDGSSGYNGGGGACYVYDPYDGVNAIAYEGNKGIGTNYNGGLPNTTTQTGPYAGKFVIGAGGGAGSGAVGQSGSSFTLGTGGIGQSAYKGGNGGIGINSVNLNAKTQYYGAGGGAGGGENTTPVGSLEYSLGGAGGLTGGGYGAGELNNGTWTNWPTLARAGTAGATNFGAGGGGGHALTRVASPNGQDGSNGTVIIKYISSYRKATI